MKCFPRKLTQWQLGWLSAMLDTDGAICFNRAVRRQTHGTGRIQVDNRSRALVEKILKVIGSGHVSVSRELGCPVPGGLKGQTFSPMYRYAAGSGVMTWLLPKLRLTGKEEQRLLAIKALPLMNRGRWKTKQEGIRLTKMIQRMSKINSVKFLRS